MGLSWIVEDGTQVQVDINEIMGCSRNIFLLGNIINQLSNFGNAILNRVANHVSSTLWRRGWLSMGALGLETHMTPS